MNEQEVLKLSAHLEMSYQDFGRKYLRYDADVERLALKDRTDTNDDSCVFLEDNKCSVYEVRPTQCRTFPWWPELVEDEECTSFCGTASFMIFIFFVCVCVCVCLCVVVFVVLYPVLLCPVFTVSVPRPPVCVKVVCSVVHICLEFLTYLQIDTLKSTHQSTVWEDWAKADCEGIDHPDAGIVPPSIIRENVAIQMVHRSGENYTYDEMATVSYGLSLKELGEKNAEMDTSLSEKRKGGDGSEK